MAASLNMGDVLLSHEDLATVRQEVETERVGLQGFAAVMTNGETRELSPEVSRTIDRVLRALASSGSVSVGVLPDELTSNVAADLVGVSRPTLLKMARDGEIDSFKVGSHTRFKLEAVMDFKSKRKAARRAAFDELREIRDGHESGS